MTRGVSVLAFPSSLWYKVVTYRTNLTELIVFRSSHSAIQGGANKWMEDASDTRLMFAFQPDKSANSALIWIRLNHKAFVWIKILLSTVRITDSPRSAQQTNQPQCLHVTKHSPDPGLSLLSLRSRVGDYYINRAVQSIWRNLIWAIWVSNLAGGNMKIVERKKYHSKRVF